MTSRLQLEIRAINGAGPGTATADLITRSLGERLRGSGLILGAGVVVGLLFLPVPLIHLFGLMAFLGCAIFAIKRFRVRTLVQRVEGLCPSCHKETSFFVGGGLMAAHWPLASQCGACGIGVRLTPMSQTMTAVGSIV